MDESRYIAVDLGAESGRVMLATLSHFNKKIELQEMHRFANVPVQRDGGLHWNIDQLWEEIQIGIRKTLACADHGVLGISVDSWGVDYVLLDEKGSVLSPPFIYRDPRHETYFDRLIDNPGAKFIFDQTGIQLMSINTLYQLCAEPKESLKSASAMVLIGDYFNYLIAGKPHRPRCEISLASTTQLLNVKSRQWAKPLIEAANLPERIFPALVQSGTKLGASIFSNEIESIATCSHDTACAVAAVPADDRDDWAYISSGTWSLAGVELSEPVVSDRCLELGFTNELGANGTTRLLKNISGLYILQQCRATWAQAGHDWTYEQLAAKAKFTPPLKSLIRPESSAFGKPGNMPARIVDYCRQTNQPAPENPEEFTRCLYESLALLYRKTLNDLKELTGKAINRLHIVGGGSRSTLLNQLTADACGITVIAGPVEATSMGNVLLQAMALGQIEYSDIRKIVSASSSPLTFQPAQDHQEAFARFLTLPSN